MAETPTRWTLEDLVDFEQLLATSPQVTEQQKLAVAAAAEGLDGAAARRAGLRKWLEVAARQNAGSRFSSALWWVAAGLCLLVGLTGISAVLGLLSNGRIHVVLFLGIFLGGQWLVLLVGGLLWLLRGRASRGLGVFQGWMGRLALRSTDDHPWWRGVMDAGGQARAALVWRFARMSQAAAVTFNLGIVLGLLGLVWVKSVGFHWETTTEVAMESFLGQAVEMLSAPWSAWWPEAVPDQATIQASRIGAEQQVATAAASWWRFLVMATLVWGMLPRLLLWILAWIGERKALAAMDFQGRAHRSIWRDLTGTRRAESGEKPLDGVLVLDVGGSGMRQDKLRPFLLRNLRVNPTSWHSTAVWDETAEQEADAAISNAPAGVVLICESWALSPARMNVVHADLRRRIGTDAPIKFLIANADASGNPVPVQPEEQQLWTSYVDSLRDPAAEVFPYRMDASVL